MYFNTNVLFTVPLQAQTITDEIKPFQTGIVFTGVQSMLKITSHNIEGRTLNKQIV